MQETPAKKPCPVVQWRQRQAAAPLTAASARRAGSEYRSDRSSKVSAAANCCMSCSSFMTSWARVLKPSALCRTARRCGSVQWPILAATCLEHAGASVSGESALCSTHALPGSVVGAGCELRACSSGADLQPVSNARGGLPDVPQLLIQGLEAVPDLLNALLQLSDGSLQQQTSPDSVTPSLGGHWCGA